MLFLFNLTVELLALVLRSISFHQARARPDSITRRLAAVSLLRISPILFFLSCSAPCFSNFARKTKRRSGSFQNPSQFLTEDARRFNARRMAAGRCFGGKPRQQRGCGALVSGSVA